MAYLVCTGASMVRQVFKLTAFIQLAFSVSLELMNMGIMSSGMLPALMLKNK
jgi:hypothetical protein